MPGSAVHAAPGRGRRSGWICRDRRVHSCRDGNWFVQFSLRVPTSPGAGGQGTGRSGSNVHSVVQHQQGRIGRGWVMCSIRQVGGTGDEDSMEEECIPCRRQRDRLAGREGERSHGGAVADFG
jgi:hypothetical protein